MIDNPFRQHLAKASPWICAIYRFLGLTPNAITILGFLVAIASAIAVGLEHSYFAFALWWISRYFDGTDGIYAREIHQSSAFGAYLDIVLDMAAYSLMILGFSFALPEMYNYWNVILFFYVLCIASALALGTLERDSKIVARDNRGLRLAAGLAEGGETGIFYSILLLVPSSRGFVVPIWIAILFLTVTARTAMAYRELQK